MAIHAYNESYLNRAMKNLGNLFEFAICHAHYHPETVFDLFISSGIAAHFESGNPKYIAGMSGHELFCEMLIAAGKPLPPASLQFFLDKTPEYWCGWILAYYQWFYNQKFKDIRDKIGRASCRERV